MKQYKHSYEAIEEFRNYQSTNEEIKSFWTEYDWSDWKMGDWVLIQYVKRGKEISRPIYGMFVGVNIWDQALVVHIIEKPRAWRWNTEILTNPELAIYMNLGGFDPEVEAFELWTSNIKVLGHWKVKPKLSELKQALNDVK
jgi:hypothetical protein